jgi:predicted transcriptional regulator
MFDYFYSHEADQFTFYQIPQELFTPKFKNLSTDAKVLYGLLLNRNSLSRKNNWLDDNGRVYIIFTREECCDKLSASKPTVSKFFKELNEIGLIEEKRQGLSKPNIIYVKNFISKPESLENQQKSNFFTSRSEKTLLQDVKKLCPSNTNINNTNINNQLVSQPDEQTNKQSPLIELLEQAQIELFESEDLKESITETISECLKDPASAKTIKKIKLEHIDIALDKYRAAQDEKEIKNPRLYFKKCLLSAITESGLKGLF